MKRVASLLAMFLGLVTLLLPWAAHAVDLVDLRASFSRIEPYTKPPSPHIEKEFSIPGPGTLEVTTTYSPWFRSTAPLRFRSLEPIDGRDQAAWVEYMPGVESLGFTSTPERWVDGSGLTIVSRARVTKPRPRLVVGLFPSVVRFGDGSLLQLANSMQVTVRWLPAAAGPTTSGAPTGNAPDVAGRWSDPDGPITLTRNGATVNGTYAFRDGRLTGTWADPNITGYWAQSLSNRRCDTERMGSYYWGRFELKLQGDQLEGRFGYCADAPNARWAWTRIK